MNSERIASGNIQRQDSASPVEYSSARQFQLNAVVVLFGSYSRIVRMENDLNLKKPADKQQSSDKDEKHQYRQSFPMISSAFCIQCFSPDSGFKGSIFFENSMGISEDARL